MKVEGKILRIRMFGAFTMNYGGVPLLLNKVGNSKSIRLLQMLLLSLENGISKSELIDGLYGWEKGDTGNHNKNLNNLIYRVKRQMCASGLPDEEYIEIKNGMCYWKSEIPLDLDTIKFEHTIQSAEESQGREHIRQLQAANEMYCGELLPMNLSEVWFFERSNYFKKLYIRTIRELEKEFKLNNDYKNLLALYSRAAIIYPFESWQTWQIRCHLEMYQYEAALDIYNKTMELYAREMGNPPMEEMQKCFEELKLKDRNHKRRFGDLKSWETMDKIFMGRQGNIIKAIFESKHEKGAYYCTYPSFIDYCRLIVRTKERYEFQASLMFLTLTQRKKNGLTEQMVLSEQMELLKTAIGTALRRGDAYTRYGNRHFILMLTKIDEDLCSIVFRRIESAYEGMPSSKGDLWYHAALTQELERSALGFEADLE
ncbi:bacterial transcriptional activator domain-containing protein [Lachnospiraceae bacterium 62-35]